MIKFLKDMYANFICSDIIQKYIWTVKDHVQMLTWKAHLRQYGTLKQTNSWRFLQLFFLTHIPDQFCKVIKTALKRVVRQQVVTRAASWLEGFLVSRHFSAETLGQEMNRELFKKSMQYHFWLQVRLITHDYVSQWKKTTFTTSEIAMISILNAVLKKVYIIIISNFHKENPL